MGVKLPFETVKMLDCWIVVRLYHGIYEINSLVEHIAGNLWLLFLAAEAGIEAPRCLGRSHLTSPEKLEICGKWVHLTNKLPWFQGDYMKGSFHRVYWILVCCPRRFRYPTKSTICRRSCVACRTCRNLVVQDSRTVRRWNLTTCFNV
jgi:hypothetical protein